MNSLSYMPLKDRLAEAMTGPPKVTQAALARACKVAQPSVNDWLSGKSKTIRGAALLAAARHLRVSPDWLATGKGSRNLNTSDFSRSHGPEVVGESHPIQMDAAILAEAEKWMRFQERAVGELQPVRRAEGIIGLYYLIEQDGGHLTPEHAQELIDAARQKQGFAYAPSISGQQG